MNTSNMAAANATDAIYEYSNYYDPNDPDRPPPPPMPAPGSAPDYMLRFNQCVTVNFISIGAILPLGLFFNILAFAVFAHSNTLRKTTTGHYLLALSIADSGYLIGEFVRWLNTYDAQHLNWTIDFLDRYVAVCKLTNSLRYASIMASAWITVVITVERFISVRFPLKVTTISTPTIAKVTILVIFLVSLFLGGFPMWTVTIMHDDSSNMTFCAIYDRHMYDVFNWISLRGMSLIIPGVIIIIFSSLLIYNLQKAKRARTRSLTSFSGQNKRSAARSRALERQLTMMLLAVANTFVLLRLPYTIAYYMHFLASGYSEETLHQMRCAVKITDIFVALNYASNFFLYCFCGSAFRKALKHLVCGRRRKGFSSSGSGRDTSMRSTWNQKLSLKLGRSKGYSVNSPKTSTDKLGNSEQLAL